MKTKRFFKSLSLGLALCFLLTGTSCGSPSRFTELQNWNDFFLFLTNSKEQHIQPGACPFGATEEEMMTAWGLEESDIEYEGTNMRITNTMPFGEDEIQAHIWFVPTGLYTADFYFYGLTLEDGNTFCSEMERWLAKYDWVDYGPQVKSVFQKRGTEPDFTVSEYFAMAFDEIRNGEMVDFACGDPAGTYVTIQWAPKESGDVSLLVKVNYEYRDRMSDPDADPFDQTPKEPPVIEK